MPSRWFEAQLFLMDIHVVKLRERRAKDKGDSWSREPLTNYQPRSVTYGVCAKARFAGNGWFHCQEVQRRHEPRRSRPSGALRVLHGSVASLANMARYYLRNAPCPEARATLCEADN